MARDSQRYTVTLDRDVFERMTRLAMARGHRSLAAMTRQWILAGAPQPGQEGETRPEESDGTRNEVEPTTAPVRPSNEGQEDDAPDTARSSGTPPRRRPPTDEELAANVVANPFEDFVTVGFGGGS